MDTIFITALIDQVLIWTEERTAYAPDMLLQALEIFNAVQIPRVDPNFCHNWFKPQANPLTFSRAK